MNKSAPHYNLNTIQSLIQKNQVRITSSALTDAAMLNYTSEDIKSVVLSLTDMNFYKSMPSHHNALIWQDVYHKTLKESDITLYIKLQLVGQAVVISFKEK